MKHVYFSFLSGVWGYWTIIFFSRPITLGGPTRLSSLHSLRSGPASDQAKNKIAYTKYSENRKMSELHCRSIEPNMLRRQVKNCYKADTTIYSDFDDILIMHMLSFCNLINVLILLIYVNVIYHETIYKN